MKRLLAMLVLAAAAVFVAAPAGVAIDYTQIEAHLTIVGTTSTTVSVQITQTAGPEVSLRIDHDCFTAQNGEGGSDRAYGVDGDVLTFNTGPSKLHGNTVTPATCWDLLAYQITGNKLWPLDYIQTL